MPVSVVTGCSGGIGSALCEILPGKVIGLDRVPGKHVTHIIDLADAASLAELCGTIGPVDHLFNVAAVQICKPLADLCTEDWDVTMAVNVRAPFILARELEISQCVVNVTSVHSRATSAQMTAYAVSKAALSGLTRSLSIELASAGVRVCSVAPGAVDTPMLRAGLSRCPQGEDAAMESLVKQHPLGKIGTPTDIARTCLFIAQSPFANGSEWVIDGGVMAKLPSE